MTTGLTRRDLERAGCTDAEIQAALLYELGLGYRAIARELDLAVTTVRDRIDRATRRIQHHRDDQEDAE